MPSAELGGVVMLQAEASAQVPEADYLYRAVTLASARAPQKTVSTKLVAAPYYSWANREASPMQVWLRRR